MSYADYLKSNRWQSTRLWALERAGDRCQVCTSTTRLDVHHNNYDRLGWEWPHDLIVLCHECHELYHDQMPTKPTAEVDPMALGKAWKRSRKERTRLS